MKRFLSTAGLSVTLAISCVSCDKIKTPQPELQKPPAVTEKSPKPEDERTTYTQAAQKELDELRTAIAELKIKAETANTETKAKLTAEIEKLEADSREVQQRLVELKSATLESWTQLKESFGKSLETLKNGIEKFRKNAG